ncbi:hypothetical protein [Archangium violaceum]|uniref:Uncharacterized protein n=1 Tax=Archangium violaceum Cb vi76 TaxID=1406225 RepID=A0A084SZL5_9BACT|nr:hypothetical protein [Archangium violaceum]KFA93900.1 hypothetical protein Q664_06425 [Archangium violaceum Cb vi76]
MEGGERRNWKQHPLLRRLPFLLLVVLGLWLWKGVDAPERELAWRLEGPGWSEIRALDLQVKNADGELVKRETRSFQSGPPGMVTLVVELPSGTYEVWVFARGESGPSRPPLVERLTLQDEDTRAERGLRLPGIR